MAQQPPEQVHIKGARCDLVGFALLTKDALYTGTNSKGETVHAVVVNANAQECQAAYLNRGG